MHFDAKLSWSLRFQTNTINHYQSEGQNLYLIIFYNLMFQIQDLKQLEILNLSSNKLEKINEKTFKGCTELQEIDLENNQIYAKCQKYQAIHFVKHMKTHMFL